MRVVQFALVLACLGQAAAAGAQTCSSIAIREITWTFSAKHPCGQFATGDWWVVPESGDSVTITGISPASTTVDGWVLHGSMLNPTPRTSSTITFRQAFDSRRAGAGAPNGRAHGYDASLDVATRMPLVVRTGSSLLSSKSFVGKSIAAPRRNVHSPYTDAIEVLTVLAAPPRPGSFRPPYVGTDKTIPEHWNVSAIDWTKLHTLKRLRTTPSIETFQQYAVEPQIELALGWQGRYLHPWNNYSPAGCNGGNPNYGQALACTYGAMLMAVNLDFTREQKEPIVLRLIQLGIDIYGAAINVTPVDEHGVIWEDGGGHNLGRKMPLLFAGYLLNDEAMLARADHAKSKIFAEDAYYFYVTEEDVKRKLSGPRNCQPFEPYTAEDIGMPEWGQNHLPEPHEDNRNFGSCYRWTTNALISHFLAAKVMGVTDLWNQPAAFDYFEKRWYTAKRDAAHPRCSNNNICEWERDLWDAYHDAQPVRRMPKSER